MALKHIRHRPEVRRTYGSTIELDSIHGVHVLTWPDDRQLRERLARSCTPRIILANPEHVPQPHELADELWASPTSSYAELALAAECLIDRVRQFERCQPWVDEYGIAHRGMMTTTLSRSEAIVRP